MLELLHRGRGAILLIEAEQRAAQHDRQDDAGIGPFAQHKRDRGAEDQDKDERAFELAQQEAQRAKPGGVLDAVGADVAQLFGGTVDGEALRRRA